MTTPSAKFQDLLSRKAADAKKPPVLPAGHYDFLIKGHVYGESKKQKTPFVQFQLVPVSPKDDVDSEQFETFGGIAALGKRIMRVDYWLTEDAMWRLKEFIEEKCGLVLGDRSFGEVIPETTNIALVGQVVHKPADDGTEIYANIGDLSANS